MWQYPGVITSQSLVSRVDTNCTNTIAPSSDTMSNGSATPPNVTNGEHVQITSSTNGTDSKFVFPSANPIPLSPGIFGTHTFFNHSGSHIPITPTLLTPAVSFTEPYIKQGQLFSPFTFTHPTAVTGSLPRTPTLPPPSPHAIGSTTFPLTAVTHQGLPTSATLVNSPFAKGTSFLDDITKIGSISPFIVSPSLSPNRKPNGTTIFFPTTITASGEAKVTSIHGSNGRLTDTPDDTNSMHSTDSPLIKREGSPHQQTCFIAKETN